MQKAHLTPVLQHKPQEHELARKMLIGIPGIRLISFDEPQHPWVMNFDGEKTLDVTSCPLVSTQAVEWVHRILGSVGFQGGEYYFRLLIPQTTRGYLWCRLELDSELQWVEPLWQQLSYFHFVNLDIDFWLVLDANDLEHRATKKQRNSYLDHLVPAAGPVKEPVAIRRINEHYAMSSDQNGDLSIWRIADRAISQLHQGYSHFIEGFSIGNNRIASYVSGNIKIWDFKTGQILKRFQKYREITNEFRSIIPFNGSRIITTLSSYPSESGFATWNVDTGEITQLFGVDEKMATNLLQIDHNHFIAAHVDNMSLRLWNISTEQSIRAFNGHTDYIQGLQKWDENTFASCSLDGSLRLWDIITGESSVLIQLNEPIHRFVSLSSSILTLSGSIWTNPQVYTLSTWTLDTGDLITSKSLTVYQQAPQRLELLDTNTCAVQLSDQVILLKLNEASEIQLVDT